MKHRSPCECKWVEVTEIDMETDDWAVDGEGRGWKRVENCRADIRPSNDLLWVATIIKYLAANPTKSLYDFGVETERTQGDLARIKQLMQHLGDETYAKHE